MSSAVESAPRVAGRTWERVDIIAWSIVAVVTAMRAVAAYSVPLIGDEGYYWEWSRHLALGYSDHPPGVAYVIFAFSWLGTNPFAVRIGFVLCGLIAMIFAAKTAKRLTDGDRRAGAVTALAIALAPLSSVAFGSASPDGPYLAAWAATLYCAVRAFGSHLRRDYVWLGIALGAVLLTRIFAFALLFGIVMYALAPSRRRFWREGLWLSLLVAGVLCIPFLIWNSTHGWATFAFALINRHEVDWRWYEPFVLHLMETAAYSPGLWIGALLSIFYARNAFLNWTAVPMIVLMTLLSFHESVEIHWMFGAYVSLSVAIGIVFVRLSGRARVIWATIAGVPALIIFPLVFIAAVEPGFVYEQFVHTGSTLRNTGGFEIFTVPSLALDVRNMMEANDATVVTDGYGLSSTLDFYGGVPPVVIGYNAQGQEAMRWYDPDMVPHRILFVDKEALVPRPGHPEDKGRPDFAQQFARACTRVTPGPTLGYEFHDSSGHLVPARLYFTTWCDPRPHALRILQWDPRYSPPPGAAYGAAL